MSSKRRAEASGPYEGGSRNAALRAANALASWPAFHAEIAHSLRLLGSLRLQVSLFAVRVVGGDLDPTAACIVAEALLRLGAVGRLADGHVGLLYLGPRSTGHRGDTTLTRHVRDLAQERLVARGFAMLAPRLEVSATHAWTDEINAVEDLARPLAERARAPAGGSAAPAFLPAFAQLAR